MNVKQLASQTKDLQRDETFKYIINRTKEDQANVFLNPHSSAEDREKAHEIVRGIAALEDCISRIISDEAVFDKHNR